VVLLHIRVMSERVLNGVRTFVARISASKTKVNGRTYEAYRLTVPRDLADAMGLKDGDHALVFLRKARWYHLIDWSDDRNLMDELPEDARREISIVRAIKEAGMIAAPGPTSVEPEPVYLRLGSAAAGLPGGGNI
jgi:bifunctional DNA-binding transcriptional regulator/antitoxin component of YhaV-PrlF toxin-antitoxin module